MKLAWLGQDPVLPPPNPFIPTPFTAEQYSQPTPTVVPLPVPVRTSSSERSDRTAIAAAAIVAAGIIAAVVLSRL